MIVQNCYNSGNLSSNTNSGGIVGGAGNVIVIGCYNIGNISSTGYKGGIVGAVTGLIKIKVEMQHQLMQLDICNQETKKQKIKLTKLD